jgi:hypothetical protein
VGAPEEHLQAAGERRAVLAAEQREAVGHHLPSHRATRSATGRHLTGEPGEGVPPGRQVHLPAVAHLPFPGDQALELRQPLRRVGILDGVEAGGQRLHGVFDAHRGERPQVPHAQPLGIDDGRADAVDLGVHGPQRPLDGVDQRPIALEGDPRQGLHRALSHRSRGAQGGQPSPHLLGREHPRALHIHRGTTDRVAERLVGGDVDGGLGQAPGVPHGHVHQTEEVHGRRRHAPGAGQVEERTEIDRARPRHPQGVGGARGVEGHVEDVGRTGVADHRGELISTHQIREHRLDRLGQGRLHLRLGASQQHGDGALPLHHGSHHGGQGGLVEPADHQHLVPRGRRLPEVGGLGLGAGPQHGGVGLQGLGGNQAPAIGVGPLEGVLGGGRGDVGEVFGQGHDLVGPHLHHGHGLPHARRERTGRWADGDDADLSQGTSCRRS